MKILHLCYRNDTSDTNSCPGLYTYIAQGISAEGRHQVLCAALLEEKNASTGQPLEWEQHYIQTVNWHFPKGKLRRLFRLYRWMRNENFDVVVSHRRKPMLALLYLAPLLRCRG